VFFNTPLKKGDSLDEEPGDTEKNADDSKEYEIHTSPFFAIITLKISGFC
jgi:hypothetical protein